MKPDRPPTVTLNGRGWPSGSLQGAPAGKSCRCSASLLSGRRVLTRANGTAWPGPIGWLRGRRRTLSVQWRCTRRDTRCRSLRARSAAARGRLAVERTRSHPCSLPAQDGGAALRDEIAPRGAGGAAVVRVAQAGAAWEAGRFPRSVRCAPQIFSRTAPPPGCDSAYSLSPDDPPLNCHRRGRAKQ